MVRGNPAGHFRHLLLTYTGLAFSPSGTLYVASVLTGRIAEFDQGGVFVRMLLEPESWLPPHATGTPQGLAVDAQGTLDYAALDLRLCHQASGGRISTSSAPSPQRETAFTTSHPW